MSDTFDNLAARAIEELEERWRDYPDNFGPGRDYAGDVIHEIADSFVPIYTAERFRVLASDPDVYGRDLELASPDMDMTELAGVAIYEALTERLWERWREIETEIEEEED